MTPNTIIKIADDTTVVGLITDNDDHLATFIASLLYIACLFTVVLFLYLPIVHLIPFLHYWLEPVSKHFTVFGTRDK